MLFLFLLSLKGKSLKLFLNWFKTLYDQVFKKKFFFSSAWMSFLAQHHFMSSDETSGLRLWLFTCTRQSETKSKVAKHKVLTWFFFHFVPATPSCCFGQGACRTWQRLSVWLEEERFVFWWYPIMEDWSKISIGDFFFPTVNSLL